MRSPYLYGGRALRPGEEQIYQNQLSQTTAQIPPYRSGIELTQNMSAIPQARSHLDTLVHGSAVENGVLTEDPFQENDSDLVRLLAGLPPKKSPAMPEVAPATLLEQVLVDMEERERSALMPQGLNSGSLGQQEQVGFSQISPSLGDGRNFTFENDPQAFLDDPKQLAQQVIGEARKTFGDAIAKRLSALADQEIEGDGEEVDQELIAAGLQVLPAVFWTTIRTALRRAAPAVFGKAGVAAAKKASKTATRNRYTRRQKRRKDRLQDEEDQTQAPKKPKKRKDEQEDWHDDIEKTASEIGEDLGWDKGPDAPNWLDEITKDPKTIIDRLKRLKYTVRNLQAILEFYEEAFANNPDWAHFGERAEGLQFLIDLWDAFE